MSTFAVVDEGSGLAVDVWLRGQGFDEWKRQSALGNALKSSRLVDVEVAWFSFVGFEGLVVVRLAQSH